MNDIVTYGGHVLNDLFFVGQVETSLPEIEASWEAKAATDGSVFKGMRLGNSTVTVPLVVRPGTDAREAVSTLMAWLDVEDPQWLAVSGDGGKRRLAVPNSASMEDYRWHDRLTVEFLQTDPALYGDEASVTVPSGGSVTFDVGGDYPTRPTIAATGARRNASTKQWGLRLDEADVCRVQLDTTAASAVEMDCAARTAKANGTATAPTLQSDWLVLEPGRHVLKMDQGTGAAEVTWVERWHR